MKRSNYDNKSCDELFTKWGIPNDYFFGNYGITNEEIIVKSRIKQRRRTQPNENANSMVTLKRICVR